MENIVFSRASAKIIFLHRILPVVREDIACVKIRQFSEIHEELFSRAYVTTLHEAYGTRILSVSADSE